MMLQMWHPADAGSCISCRCGIQIFILGKDQQPIIQSTCWPKGCYRSSI